MKTMTDIHGVTYSIEKAYIVTATDKCFSGWGMASGKTHKQIVICEDYNQADKVAENMRKKGFTYVYIRRDFPSLSSTRYTWSINHADDCPLWNK